MNTQLTLTRSSIAPRAAFSPIRARRTPRAAANTVPDVMRLEHVDVKIPAWHRGPLDRLQPVLTRFRD